MTATCTKCKLSLSEPDAADCFEDSDEAPAS